MRFTSEVVKMAFTWTSISVGDVIKADHINEIKNNLDSLFSWEGVSWSWTYLPVSAGQVITYEQFKELRDATDYADDNKCKTEHYGYDSGVDSGDNESEHAEYLVEDLTINYDVVDDGHLSGHDGTDREGVDSGYNTGAHADEDSGYNRTYLGTEYAPHNDSVRSGDDGTHNSGYNSPVNTSN